MSDLPVTIHKSPYEGADVGEYTERIGHNDKNAAQGFAKHIISKGGKARIGKRGSDFHVYHKGAGPISMNDYRKSGAMEAYFKSLKEDQEMKTRSKEMSDSWKDKLAVKIARKLTGDKETPMLPSEKEEEKRLKQQERDEDARKLKQRLSADKRKLKEDQELSEEELEEVSMAAMGHAADRDFGNHGSARPTLSKTSMTSSSAKYKLTHKKTGKVISIHKSAPEAVTARNKIGNSESHAILKEEKSMNENVSDLIDAISTGSTLGIESSFNAAMAEKLVTALDTYKEQVANNLFANTPVEEGIETPRKGYMRPAPPGTYAYDQAAKKAKAAQDKKDAKAKKE